MPLRVLTPKDVKQFLPLKVRQKIGADIYNGVLDLRLKILGAEVKQHGTDKIIEYTEIVHNRPERLVFLPGFADSKENFYDCAHFLQSGFDMLIPDLPGFGRSFKRKGQNYNLGNYGEWMQKFIEDLGWTDFHLVGNSLGGAVAIELALRMPERLKSLTLIDPAGIVFPEVPSIYDEFLNERSVFEIHSPMRFEYFLNRIFYKPPVIPPLVWDHLYRDFSRHSKWHRKILNDLLEGIESMQDPRLPEVVLNSRLKNIQTPTLCLWGDEDTFFPSQTGYFVQAQVPQCKFYLLANRGHAPQIEAPRQVTQLIRKFVSGLAKKKTAV